MDWFKDMDAKLCTNQLIVFESNHVEFKLTSNSDGKWIIKTMNSHIVSFEADFHTLHACNSHFHYHSYYCRWRKRLLIALHPEKHPGFLIPSLRPYCPEGQWMISLH